MQVNGQTNFEFGYVSHPQKLLENTQGVIYIYTTSNGKTLPITTDGLKVSSSDTSIMEIVNVANNGDLQIQLQFWPKNLELLIYL